MKIEVTQDDITKGKRQSVRNCPIACALKRACFDQDVVVGSFNASVGEVGKARYRRFLLPRNAQSFINLFDDIGALAVAPFTFEAPDNLCEPQPSTDGQ